MTDAAYAACLRLAREHYENFPVASRLLPRAMRPHIAAIYAFARIADDFADEGTAPPAVRLERLEDWQRRLHAAASGAPIRSSDLDADAVFIALSETIRRCRLDVALFEDLLGAFGQDVLVTRYERWEDLLDYCRRSANPVGRLVLAVAGCRDAGAGVESDAVCTALQLTNFWQDLERDWRHGRLYVPLAIVRDAGAAEADLDRAVWTPAWRRALQEVGGRTRALFEAGRAVTGRVARTAALGTLRHVAWRRPGAGAARARRLRCLPVAAVARLARRRAHRLESADMALRGSVSERATRSERGGEAPSESACRESGGKAPGSRMTRKTSFYYSFLVLPAPQRRAILAVFDFCRAVDDSVDLETDVARAGAGLQRWREEVGRVFDGATPRTPQGRQLQPFVKSFRLPQAQFDALVEGVAMDAAPRRYASFAELEPYCHRVASSVGLICAAVFDARDPASAAYALDLGVALQLTNILRDVAVDLRRDRCYLPGDDLQQFGVSEADLRSELERGGRGVQSDRVRALLGHQASARAPSSAGPRPPSRGRRPAGSSPPRSCTRSTVTC